MTMALIPDVILSLSKTGLFIELPVNEESAPFLVSKTRGLLWLEAAHRKQIRAAVVPGTPSDDLFLQVVREVQSKGIERQWGNSFPNTPEGLTEALAYLRYYEQDELELLTSDLEFEASPSWEAVTVVIAPWVPKGCVVIVPQDRQYLGMVGLFKDAHTVVLNNPTRGMAIVGDWSATA